ncbi:MAG: lipoyl(octanoyl) transferase LipB [Spirochaetia bacterium]|jgi:lipoate-protein ligase B|nr:lipoyl(octanoyl) transferase LipB [Spirochaetia bacterium]
MLGLIDYSSACEIQQREKLRVLEKESPGCVFFLEHHPVITLGRHCGAGDILYPETFLDKQGYSVARSSRGGNVTVHEPGQLVVYYVLPVKSKDSAAFVSGIAGPVISALNSHFGTNLSFPAENPGIWQDGKKCASIGFDLRQGVSMHGMAVNVCNSLLGFSFVNPCGMSSSVMTTLSALAERNVTVEETASLLASIYV